MYASTPCPPSRAPMLPSNSSASFPISDSSIFRTNPDGGFEPPLISERRRTLPQPGSAMQLTSRHPVTCFPRRGRGKQQSRPWRWGDLPGIGTEFESRKSSVTKALVAMLLLISTGFPAQAQPLASHPVGVGRDLDSKRGGEVATGIKDVAVHAKEKAAYAAVVVRDAASDAAIAVGESARSGWRFVRRQFQ